MLQIDPNNIPLTEIFEPCIQAKNSRLFILREDLIHPQISGNKWRKLKYNIAETKRQKKNTILTFGGAYSNHIAATAAAGKHFGLKTIGVIRGEENLPLNPTLQLAKGNGMVFKYVSREAYRNKNETTFIAALKAAFGEFYLVPEGGSNVFAVKGCTEIIENIAIDFDVICVACGTGGTLAGIIASTEKEVLGFPALKGGSFLIEDVQQLLLSYNPKLNKENWNLNTDYHFGGYAKVKPNLIAFVQQFKQKHNIPLDLIYTGKMLFGIYDLLQNTNQLDNKVIVAVHTGGVQGNKGFEERLGIKL
ncbi:MAG: 1-aminocyclopropane-1-carboxylate deaminase/D-cysteine desulfhydrase [Vicingaceae bacterium]